MATVRKAKVEDLPRILELATHFITATQYTRWFKPDPRALGELAEQLITADQDVTGADGGGVLLLLEVERQVVGMLAALVFRDPYIGNRPVFDEICWWVEPEHRNGLGGVRLLKAAEQWCRQKGLSLLKMVAPAEAPDVAEFYRRSGYITLETVFYKRLS